jgi:hypothetical protein
MDASVNRAFSLEPPELEILVMETKRARQCSRAVVYAPNETEKT